MMLPSKVWMRMVGLVVISAVIVGIATLIDSRQHGNPSARRRRAKSPPRIRRTLPTGYADARSFIPGQLIIGVVNETPANDATAVVREHGDELVGGLGLEDVVLIRIVAGTEIAKIKEYASDLRVRYAHVNAIRLFASMSASSLGETMPTCQDLDPWENSELRGNSYIFERE